MQSAAIVAKGCPFPFFPSQAAIVSTTRCSLRPAIDTGWLLLPPPLLRQVGAGAPLDLDLGRGVAAVTDDKPTTAKRYTIYTPWVEAEASLSAPAGY